MADQELWDGLHRRLRPVRTVSEFGTEQDINVVERVYGPEDISTLYIVLKLLEQRDEVRIIEPAQGARLGVPELPAIPKLIASVSHLRANGLLEYKSESSEGRVTYGPRIREIAKQSGITLRERETA